MDFTQVIGHDKIIRNLQNAIKGRKISHSYLFEGVESTGKKMVALTFAKTLLCEKRELEPCNQCKSCLKFDNFNHPDCELIESDNSIIKKENIDKIIENLSIAPLEGDRRIIIIDDCHKIRMEGQNSLLKTLEEPPSYINIILITSNTNGIIPTILSRCERIKFYPVASKKIEKLLTTKYGRSPEEAKFIINFTKGSVGQAIKLSQSEDFFQRRDKVLKIIDDIIKGNTYRVFDSENFFKESKEDWEEILDIILYWFRDLILYKELGKSELLLNKDKISLLSSQVFLKEERINDIIEKVAKVKKDIQRNVNYQLAIETMLLSMQEV